MSLIFWMLTEGKTNDTESRVETRSHEKRPAQVLGKAMVVSQHAPSKNRNGQIREVWGEAD